MVTMTTQTLRGWIPDTSTFASRLAVIRQSKHWNVKQAAEQAGVPVQSWRNWELGTRPQDMPRVVEQLAKTLHVDRDWLMWGSVPGSGSGGITPGWWSPWDGVSDRRDSNRLLATAS